MDGEDGSLSGNGKEDADRAGHIEPDQILTMQVDTDAGNLRFWVDDKPSGPGYTSRVAGPLRWATAAYWKTSAIEIVPMPELQPWKTWEPREETTIIEFLR